MSTRWPKDPYRSAWKKKSDATAFATNVTSSKLHNLFIVQVSVIIVLFIDYIQATAALIILALATDIFATLLTGKNKTKLAR